MKTLQNITLFLVLATIAWSCNQDFGKATVTYTKATGIYGDLEAIRATELIAAPRSIENAGKIFISNDILLIGEEGQGIHVLDNSDPKNPTSKLFINIPGNLEFYVENDMLFAESVYDMLKIDISNAEQPQLVTRVENAFAETLYNQNGEALVGFNFEVVTEDVEINGDNNMDDFAMISPNTIQYFNYLDEMIPPSAVPTSFAGNGDAIGAVNRLAYTNDHLYVVTRYKMLIFNDAANFELTNSFYAGNMMETVYPLNNKLYIGSQSSMEVFNINDPANPNMESSFWHETSCDPVFPANNETAYLTLRTGDFAMCPGDVNALYVLDISNSNTRELDQIEMESPFGMTMIGDELFVGEGENGLKIFDATDRRNLKLKKWDKSMHTYDVIAHPQYPSLILVAGPTGFSQYQIASDYEFELLSAINF